MAKLEMPNIGKVGNALILAKDSLSIGDQSNLKTNGMPLEKKIGGRTKEGQCGVLEIALKNPHSSGSSQP